MLARILNILAALAIAVVTTIGAAHAARMGGLQADHAFHHGETMHASPGGHPPCDGGEDHGSTDAGLCEFACAGLSFLLTMPAVEAGRAFRPAGHGLPPGAARSGRSPGLNERPPQLRLL
ncbi:hypothetical protein [Oceanicella sp. SM1341]|uniref:hypothetical protein n=1 Tax=Oceanicella sp. SM1341 TaxID=1548889 RepID=UPI000E4D5D54|nr:hypothetical protein [Oceanicella sp. SM1341]